MHERGAGVVGWFFPIQDHLRTRESTHSLYLPVIEYQALSERTYALAPATKRSCGFTHLYLSLVPREAHSDLLSTFSNINLTIN
jgi:hypothetical protein